MGLFDHLDQLEVHPEQTAPCRLPELGPRAVVQLAFAGEFNKPYWDARLGPGLSKIVEAAKSSGGDTKAVESAALAVAEHESDLTEARNRDAALYPQFIIKGWEGIPNTEGEDVPFSVEAATELVEKLVAKAPDMFDRMRAVASKLGNYRKPIAARSEIAKNS